MNREKLEQKARDLAFELGLYYYEDLSCYNVEKLKREIKKLERIIKVRDKGELYINIDDYQNSDFALGRIGTSKQWREQAIEWLDCGCSECLQNKFSSYYIKNSELIDYINNMWEIEIVKFDKNVDYEKEYNLELYYM